ncbi:hypothetical protein PAXINDRAFT_14265 [Paxillus involutus ATCC 200175]|uniref:Uncharacterized protein n=1 Tax=Paxillus involutus ATCC 200175 TaxID=664439 RepID=A0A0C9U010_PAXIN|nr:hypothetical protein PAXINDRAFT_14265 [Paxillus involutus ATCC 200175]
MFTFVRYQGFGRGLEEAFDDLEDDEDARRLRRFGQDDDPWVTKAPRLMAQRASAVTVPLNRSSKIATFSKKIIVHAPAIPGLPGEQLGCLMGEGTRKFERPSRSVHLVRLVPSVRNVQDFRTLVMRTIRMTRMIPGSSPWSVKTLWEIAILLRNEARIVSKRKNAAPLLFLSPRLPPLFPKTSLLASPPHSGSWVTRKRFRPTATRRILF